MDKNEMSDTPLLKKYIDSVDGIAHQSAIEIIINLEKKLEAAYERGFVDGVQKNSESRVSKFMDRKWVGLTDDEIKAIIGHNHPEGVGSYARELFKQIEAKLKDKNT